MPPLSSLRVLDLSRLLPGPYCSLLLADLGADVVKVEDPEIGDYARVYPPMAGELSGIFAALNRDKRSIALNLKSPAGAAVLRRLAQHADVLLESFRPGVMDRLGLGAAGLLAQNPRLIYCALSGYGQQGPSCQRAGHDVNYAALAGILALTGIRGETPVLPGVQVGDVGGALYGALAIVAAVLERATSGKGKIIDISLTESALSFLTLVAGKQAAGLAGITRGEDELAGGLPCYGVYPTADGRAMALGALEPKFWQRFCEAVGRSDLMDQGYLRGAAGDPVRAELAALFRTRTRAEWEAFFAPLDVCCEPVLEPDELAAEPVHEQRESFVRVDGLQLLRNPLTPRGASHQGAPALGAHTRQVLTEAGYTPGEIEALFTQGAAAQG